MQDLTVRPKQSGLRDMRNLFLAELLPIYERRECERIVELVFHSLAGVAKVDFALYPDRLLSELQCDILQNALEELKKFRPVQYVLGRTEFFGIELEVNQSVLIPRPETEELVKWAIDDHRGRKKLRVLDIGTGSGCIALAIMKHLPGSQVFAVDVSAGAILTAEKNARNLALPVTFLSLDILGPENPHKRMVFDLIISNPPYVTEREKKYMKRNVLDYEPTEALFVPNDDPLRFYRAIIEFSAQQLDETGAVYVEINERFGKETARLFERNGFTLVTLRKDISGKDRMIRAVR